jgi:hypothetical protein
MPAENAFVPVAERTTAFTDRSSDRLANVSRSSDIIARVTAFTGGRSSRTTATAPSRRTANVSNRRASFS